nr:uracil phosphoribosyltransferase [Ahnfeltia fastigiata]
MQLNVYIISHPLIKQIASITNNENLISCIKEKKTQQLGLLLIYETIRRWLIIQSLYIKKLHLIKEIDIIHKTESYTIITNIPHNQSLVSEITTLLPNSQLSLIHIYEKEGKWHINHKCNFIPNIIEKYKKIIIIEKYLQTGYITELLDYLLSEKNVRISQIRITCIACQALTLEILGAKYPYLSIYTTKIVENQEVYNKYFLSRLNFKQHTRY